jgi:hypothetical protein
MLQFCDSPLPDKLTIFCLMKHLHVTGSVNDKCSGQPSVLSDESLEKIHEICHKLQESLGKLAQQNGLGCVGAKILKFYPYSVYNLNELKKLDKKGFDIASYFKT